jgi:hypothetical protein
MRTALIAACTLFFLAGLTTSAFGQGDGGQCQCPQCQQARQAAAMAAQQAAVQPAMMYASQPPAAGVQPAGFGHAMGGGNCPPGSPCYGGGPGYGGAGGHGAYPGGPFHGGHYGYFGGAHRTPGYPHHHLRREYVGPQGPPTAQVGYPYYTIRGPRDFLLDNPPSIGR